MLFIVPCGHPLNQTVTLSSLNSPLHFSCVSVHIAVIEDISSKTTLLTEQSAKVGLKININNTKVLKIKAENQNPIMAGEDQLGEVDQFTYLGSIVDLKGGTDADIKA